MYAVPGELIASSTHVRLSGTGRGRTRASPPCRNAASSGGCRYSRRAPYAAMLCYAMLGGEPLFAFCRRSTFEPAGGCHSIA